ncbi:excinuclease ABC subunit UvrB [Candidatus Gracilibacteria bacterium]|nr:excinuclease ABC subunit UvrB [Candidatus Gracilibacteria bacterium]
MFKLKSKYSPTGDQPNAIEKITKYINNKNKFQTLWGVTGSGKTFVMANIIEKIQKPTLIIAHNKTLAAQLALEFKDFFPDARVHYFVSYYDYYQPEAYAVKTDTYIEKEATINEEIDRLRHAATQDLIRRKDVIIVASVSCIYGVGDIRAYEDAIFKLKVGEIYSIEVLLKTLILLQYKRAGADFKPGMFQVMGDLLEIYGSSMETVYSIEFFGDEIDRITRRNYLTGEVYEILQEIEIFPAKHTVTTKEQIKKIVPLIKSELEERLSYFKEIGDVLKYERLKTKVEYDIEMMQEVGYVNGIENYSKYLDGRKTGEPPYTLIDYFGDDFLCFVDESHMTISQIGGMYAGDRARKENLVNHGFRLPSALDHRPLRFEEFEAKIPQMVLVSATPGKYDIEKSSTTPDKFFEFNPIIDGAWVDNEENRIVPLVIRPTGLLDPFIELKTMNYMVDDVLKNINECVKNNEKMLITTLTKRSSEELTDYLLENGIKVRYLHSEIETLDRIDILRDLRIGKIDVIVGVNLLREGLDLPEVTKIAILDADKQGFLRSTSALIQIIGRAARNSKGKVYMYSEEVNTFKGEKIKWDKQENIFTLGNNKNILPTDYLFDENGNKVPLFKFDEGKYFTQDKVFVSNAMKQAINLTNYRRNMQNNYNIKHNITPTTVYSEIKEIGIKTKNKDYALISEKDLEKELKKLEFEMGVAASNMDYELAAELRDVIIELKRGRK